MSEKLIFYQSEYRLYGSFDGGEINTKSGSLNMVNFILANTVFPIVVNMLLAFRFMPMPVAFGTLVGSTLLLFGANIYFFSKHPRHRFLIGVVAILNILSLILISHIGVVTGAPALLSLLARPLWS